MPFALSTGVAFAPVTHATTAWAACCAEAAVPAAAENLISDWNSPGSAPRISTPLIGRISLKRVITNPALPSAAARVAGPGAGARRKNVLRFHFRGDPEALEHFLDVAAARAVLRIGNGLHRQQRFLQAVH